MDSKAEVDRRRKMLTDDGRRRLLSYSLPGALGSGKLKRYQNILNFKLNLVISISLPSAFENKMLY